MSALLAVSWEWELRGTLIVIIAVGVLCGSVYLILGTNMGARLGFLVAFTALAGWMFIMGGIFVVETLSVMLQVGSFKLTGKRIFRMAPLHHHYELKGWKENQVVVRFWIITMMLVLVGLSTLKLR